LVTTKSLLRTGAAGEGKGSSPGAAVEREKEKKGAKQDRIISLREKKGEANFAIRKVEGKKEEGGLMYRGRNCVNVRN